ncbi:hypothetical protein G6F37_003473 [Rhizopus arrhizus]|nr:hypothetical protein G6F38_003932 [Rhizopus arrhizus]KAG1160987.1 hypothetical protein G6F37_003473 [Rhizopus arrhizus]
MTSLPSSPTLMHHDLTPPPWNHSLSNSFKKNYENKERTIYLPMSNRRRSGEISMHCLPFKGFLEGHHLQYLKFTLAMNDHTLMGDIKSDRHGRISWIMPHTQEYYLFKGKFSIASSPLQLTRYPPPKISEKDDYWENQRIELWNELDEKTRTTFSWPSRGDTPRANFIPLETVSEQVAMDNFCLLIYKITEVEHLDHSTFPPKRMLYTLPPKSNLWKVDTANP